MPSVYTPDATNAAQPADSDYAYLIAAEMRTLKSYLASQLSNIAAIPSVAQTVLAGPVDSNGFAAFGGSTGSTTVTASGTLKAAVSAGLETNYIGTIANPSWTGLATNGTMYLYLDITSGGVVTTGSSVLAPAYQFGGTYSIATGQYTFNIQEMVMKVGNGTTATQVTRVFVGEVTVAAGVVSTITWYALKGQYQSPDTAWPAAATAVSLSHNIGALTISSPIVQAVCQTTDAGYAVGDIIIPHTQSAASYSSSIIPWKTAKTCGFTTGATAAINLINKSTGVEVAGVGANWKYRVILTRGW